MTELQGLVNELINCVCDEMENLSSRVKSAYGKHQRREVGQYEAFVAVLDAAEKIGLVRRLK